MDNYLPDIAYLTQVEIDAFKAIDPKAENENVKLIAKSLTEVRASHQKKCHEQYELQMQVERLQGLCATAKKDVDHCKKETERLIDTAIIMERDHKIAFARMAAEYSTHVNILNHELGAMKPVFVALGETINRYKDAKVENEIALRCIEAELSEGKAAKDYIIEGGEE